MGNSSQLRCTALLYNSAVQFYLLAATLAFRAIKMGGKVVHSPGSCGPEGAWFWAGDALLLGLQREGRMEGFVWACPRTHCQARAVSPASSTAKLLRRVEQSWLFARSALPHPSNERRGGGEAWGRQCTAGPRGPPLRLPFMSQVTARVKVKGMGGGGQRKDFLQHALALSSHAGLI